MVSVFLPRLPRCCLLSHLYFLFTFPSKRYTAERSEGCFEVSYSGKRVAEVGVQHALLLSSRKLSIAQVLLGKVSAECKRNRSLQNSFDFNGKELSDE